MAEALTCRVRLVSPAVLGLGAAKRFSVDAFGWTVSGSGPSYAAVLVSDVATIVTLPRFAESEQAASVDCCSSIGLHQLALKVAKRDTLVVAYERLRVHPDITVEFASGPMRNGSLLDHFICAMPGGVRLELVTACG